VSFSPFNASCEKLEAGGIHWPTYRRRQKNKAELQRAIILEYYAVRLNAKFALMMHAVCAMFLSFDVLENISMGVSMHSDAIGKHKLFFIHSNQRS
jgi:hypothetical protein